MNLSRSLAICLAALAGVTAVFAIRLAAQNVPQVPIDQQRFFEAREDATFVERFVDADGKRYIDERLPDGTVHRRPIYVPAALDPESQKLLDQEQAAAQEVRRITGNLLSIAGTPEAKQAEWKAEIREKLVAIFDLQQQRRNREIAKIEERLGKLKETLKKRDAAKDEIVDRRLQTLTGGVDELGWEDSLAGPANPLAQPPGASPYPAPRFDPEPRRVPSAVGPRTGIVPAYPVPELPPGAIPTPPAPARVPVAPGAPVPPVAPAPALSAPPR